MPVKVACEKFMFASYAAPAYPCDSGPVYAYPPAYYPPDDTYYYGPSYYGGIVLMPLCPDAAKSLVEAMLDACPLG